MELWFPPFSSAERNEGMGWCRISCRTPLILRSENNSQMQGIDPPIGYPLSEADEYRSA